MPSELGAAGSSSSNNIDGFRPISPIEMATTTNNIHQVDNGDTDPLLDKDAPLLSVLPGDETISSSADVLVKDPRTSASANPCLAYTCVAVLCLINLLNYMDRFTVSGVLLDIKDPVKGFGIGNSKAGLLQTAFICSYMILSPIFGYMGDRYSRKLIMIVGILFWSAVTLGGSFCTNEQFYLFLFLRACVGVGEASYSTIAPTIIADLFVKDKRSNMLAIFYFAIPVGSGLGYIVGAQVAEAVGEWRWALRVTPGLGLISVILIAVLVREPARGEAEGGNHLHATSWGADLLQLARNKSFIFTSLGFTAVAFVAGALAFWAPAFVTYSIRVQEASDIQDESSVALVFGIITCAAGFIGVALGSQISRTLRKVNPRADPLVCATGMLLCTPFLYFSLITSQYNTTVTWILIFLGETMLCLNWSIVADIVLYVVIPTRRSTAEAFQILLSHTLGDAGSPYLIGAISDLTKDNFHGGDTAQLFMSLQCALYSTTFACVVGGAFFLLAALFVERDRARVEMITKKSGPVVIEGALAGEDGEESPSDDELLVT